MPYQLQKSTIYYVRTVVKKLQFICIQTELVYIGKRRTTLFNENGA